MSSTISTKSSALMTLRDVQAIAPVLFLARNSKDRPVALHMTGAPGTGKTMMGKAVVIQEARANPGVAYGYGAANIQTATPADIAGFTLFETQRLVDGTGDAVERKVSAFTVPTLFAFHVVYIADSNGIVESITHDDFGRPLYVGSIVRGKPVLHGLILLDEFMQGDAENRKAVAPLLDEGRIATHFLPRGVSVWAASNRATDKSGTTKALAFLTNRVVEVGIQNDIDATMAFFEGRADSTLDAPIMPLAPLDVRGRANGRLGHHPAILTFLRQNQDMLFAGVPADPGTPFLTPRAAELVGNIFDAMMVHPDDQPVRIADDSRRVRLFMALASGAMGDNNAAQLQATIELFDEIPPLAEILRNPRGAKVSDKKDAQLVCAYMVSNAMDLQNGVAFCEYLKRLGDAFYKNAMVNAATRNGALIALPQMQALFANDPSAITRMMNARANAERISAERARAGARAR